MEKKIKDDYSTISLSMAAIKKNVGAILECLNKKALLMAVVKANGYGHGAYEVAKAALDSGAVYLGVARVGEGIELRTKGIKAPILILGPTLEKESEKGVIYDLTLTLTHLQQIKWIEKACRKHQKKALIHIKVDTGMNRIGTKTLEETQSLYDAAKKSEHIKVTGAFTHFSKADEDSEHTKEQLTTFKEICSQTFGREVLIHGANTAATLSLPQSHLDMVRVGIGLYGYSPVKTSVLFHQAMEWKSKVTYIKVLSPKEAIGYGGTFITDRSTKVATIGIGYGDGYLRSFSNKSYVLVKGHKAKVLGNICMDQTMIDVTQIEDLAIGDEVMLMGKQGNEEITAEDLATWGNTISYEILLSPTNRVVKEYID